MQLIYIWLVVTVREVTSTANIAANRPVIAGSQFEEYVPHLAVDGNTDQRFYEGKSCYHSMETDQWLLIDLQRLFDIDKVTLYVHDSTLQGETDPRFTNIVVEVFRSNPALCPEADISVCAVYPGPASPQDTLFLLCKNSTQGRYVRVRKTTNGGGWYDMLILCEVQIEGSVVSKCTENEKLLAKKESKMTSLGTVTAGVSRIECLRRCYYDNRCYGINYGNESDCQLVSEFNTTNIHEASPGWNFYTVC